MAVLEPLILDSVTHLTEAHRGQVGYCASHGGIYAAYYAAKMGVGAVILNDAGIGREQAGIAGLGYLQKLGVPAATVTSISARIGDGQDGLANGYLSHVNDLCRSEGMTDGISCRSALEVLARAGLPPAPSPPVEAEHRHEVDEARRGKHRVIVMDSASLVTAADQLNVVITGSHGGVLGGRAATALKYPALAAVFNDAGGGRDHAGVSRLPALEDRGIPAACVSHFSARIGDGRSTYEDGYISALNQLARRHGGCVGQSTREFVAAILRSVVDAQ